MTSVPYRTIMLLQGIYYTLTGIWPLVHLASFEAVTGKKADRFTLRTTATLIVTVGSILVLGSRRKRPDLGFAALGALAAVSLASVVFAHARKLRPVYLLEAVGEIILAGTLLGTALLSSRRSAERQ